MSQELGYFPPQGTEHHWSNKALNCSPWYCLFWDHWPARISANVDLINGKYKWMVFVCNFKHERHELHGTSSDALSACKEAEKIAMQEKNKIWFPWMEEAVKAGWRPPC